MPYRAAMIMAGGSGLRMSRSGSVVPKPLVRIAGVALLERNLQQLLRFGFDKVYISIAHDNDEVRQFIDCRLQPLANLTGVQLETVVEAEARGNIGAAGLVAGNCSQLLVVFADNLTSIDLLAICQMHSEQTSDLTLATHKQSFRMPFGELEFDATGSLITDYIEKPETTVSVSSAIAVLGPWALQHLASVKACGMSELSQAAIEMKRKVNAFHHTSPWIDVNDLASVRRAESLIAHNFEQFEYWWPHRARLVRWQENSASETSARGSTCAPGRKLSVADIEAGEMLTVSVEAVGNAELLSVRPAIDQEIIKRLAGLVDLSATTASVDMDTA